MFDFATKFEEFDVTPEVIEPEVLGNALAKLSDDELSNLEDDLDFCNFAGVPSARILKVLNKLIELDESWKALLKEQKDPEVPSAY